MKRIQINEDAREWLVLAALVVAVVLVAVAVNSMLPGIEARVRDLGLYEPTPVALDCHEVRVPGYLYAHQLCTMPDGTQCLFYNSNTPTTCYPEVETK